MRIRMMTSQTRPSQSSEKYFIIIDDPIKPTSDEQLERARHWYEAPPLPISGTVLMGHWQLPWHEDDLASRLLEDGNHGIG